MTHVTYRLTAKNRDQLRDPTLGNRLWAVFTFLPFCSTVDKILTDIARRAVRLR